LGAADSPLPSAAIELGEDLNTGRRQVGHGVAEEMGLNPDVDGEGVTVLTVDASPVALQGVKDGKLLATSSQGFWLQGYAPMEWLYGNKTLNYEPQSDILTGAVVGALFIAALCGWLQALAAVKGGLPSMIVTLGGLFAFRGVIYVWTGGSVRAFPQEAREHGLTRLFGGEIFGVEAALFWMLLLLLILSLMLWQTRFGNQLLATGGSAASAETRGVLTDRVKTNAFVLCSLLGAVLLVHHLYRHRSNRRRHLQSKIGPLCRAQCLTGRPISWPTPIPSSRSRIWICILVLSMR
jgi:hypothetical protein